jgi:DNA replication and repair protein RecF
VTTLVFTPDRLVVVKGGPRAAGLLRPRARAARAARAGLSAEYGARLASATPRCARRAGRLLAEALAPWNEQVSRSAAELVEGRHETVAALQPRFASGPASSGSPEASCATRRGAERRASSSAARPRPRTRRDGPRARTSTTSACLAGERDLRAFGSQGEQRLAVLALLLGEAELLEERRGDAPLLLLDDVLSELDPDRRRILADRLRRRARRCHEREPNALPGEPAQTLEVAQRDDGTSEVA